MNRPQFLAILAVLLALGSAQFAGAGPAAERAPLPDLGQNASLHGQRPFPADNAWNRPIDKEPVDPASDTLINSIGRKTRLHPDFGANWNGGPFGIPYVVVPGKQPKVPITYAAYGNESDPGPFPVPLDASIEGGPKSDGDRHVLVIDRDNWKLYELYRAFQDGQGWKADSGALFDLKSGASRPAGWTVRRRGRPADLCGTRALR